MSTATEYVERYIATLVSEPESLFPDGVVNDDYLRGCLTAAVAIYRRALHNKSVAEKMEGEPEVISLAADIVGRTIVKPNGAWN